MFKFITGICLGFLLALPMPVKADEASEASRGSLRKEAVIGVAEGVSSQTKSEVVAGETRFIIKSDGGGSVKEYSEAVEYMKSKKMKVRVDGMCASACTLLLSKTNPIDLCITDNAVFGVHKPYSVQMTSPFSFDVNSTVTATVGAEKIWQTGFLGQYPDWLVSILSTTKVPSVMEGAKPSELFNVDAKMIGANIKRCN